MVEWQEKLKSGWRHPDNEAQYAKCFDGKNTPVHGALAVAEEEALSEAKRNYGHFALLSKEIRNPMEALTIYRNDKKAIAISPER